jgi:glutamyl-tRNA synthetase/nondiscriminating glutamyl-tRNA synthetase
MRILPEALRNYLLLLGWSASDGKTEKLRIEEMIAQFSFDRITKSPAVFDQKKLDWLNAQYVFELPPQRKLQYFRNWLEELLISKGYLSESETECAHDLTYRLIEVVADSPDRTHLLDVVEVVFGYDAAAVVSGGETRHVVEDAAARQVLEAFIPKALEAGELTYARFREIAKTVQNETGKKGKDLLHPIRVAVTGAVSGPELEKLIPIFEEGAKLPLTRHVKSVVERLREFAQTARMF